MELIGAKHIKYNITFLCPFKVVSKPSELPGAIYIYVNLLGDSQFSPQ